MSIIIPDHVEAHDSSHHSRLNALRAGVLGANDGIVSVAALVLGVVATGAQPATILISGMAAAVAGAASMALGEYVSVSTQRDTERMLVDKERAELADAPEAEHRELVGILQGYGISADTADRAAREMEEGDLLGAHLRLELGLDSEDLTNPSAAAASSAASFLVGAALPLLTVLIAPGSAWAIVAVTLVALALTGAASAKLSETRVPQAVVRLVVGGALGLAVTYGIGSLFGV